MFFHVILIHSLQSLLLSYLNFFGGWRFSTLQSRYIAILPCILLLQAFVKKNCKAVFRFLTVK